MLIGQLAFHFLLKYQRQSGMRIGIRGVQLQGFFQRRFRPPGITLLQVTDAQLDISIAGGITALIGAHGINVAGGYATRQHSEQ